jgi:hypothetical protein
MNKLYRIWQIKNSGYDTYDSAIVCAETEEEAKNTKVGSVNGVNGTGQVRIWEKIGD